MTFHRLKTFICSLWERFNVCWAEACEIQRQIDERRAEYLRRNMTGGNDYDRFR
jgi:hypothetical protein